jgi:S-adenosylmethionine/arginine decarboxylase-like enzyme/antitoxin (DNA-binding transcriptional repressor) of toxin-antitoxin stability system
VQRCRCQLEPIVIEERTRCAFQRGVASVDDAVLVEIQCAEMAVAVGKIELQRSGGLAPTAPDFGGCTDLVDRAPDEILATFCAALRRAGATVVHELSHSFPATGLTCALILSESHAVLHTWPETGTINIDIFSCSTRLKSLEAIDELKSSDLLRNVSVLLDPEIDPPDMCHNVHMKTISIRELHLKTGQWVRLAASRGPIVVTDRGRRVAALQPFDASTTGRPLPNREAAIRKRSKIPVDSVVYQSELREDR